MRTIPSHQSGTILTTDYRKIIICSTSTPTGGPEVLHQLASELTLIGLDASILYYPLNQQHTCPDAYLKYKTRKTELNDDSKTLFIIPETATWLTKIIKKGAIAVWWLSVDNYYLAKKQSIIADIYWRARSLVRARVPIFKIKKLMHFAQSEYAAQFLRTHGIAPIMLSDSLGREHLMQPGRNCNASNIIAYNPSKGLKESTSLINKYPEFDFVPILNMSHKQVRALLEQAKIYMDFGNHPGKDRLPREAAMAGCCVITGRKGSAANTQDIPIPSRYKLDDTTRTFLHDFGPLVTEVFENYGQHQLEFDLYRELIKNETQTFKNQIQKIFGILAST